jgi:hypothetical protein
MKPIWRWKWQDLARKRVKNGLVARSSTLTLRGPAISPSFGFGRPGHLRRRERLENEPHFLRFRFWHLARTIQTKSPSFMGPYPRQWLSGRQAVRAARQFVRIANVTFGETPELPGEDLRLEINQMNLFPSLENCRQSLIFFSNIRISTFVAASTRIVNCPIEGGQAE